MDKILIQGIRFHGYHGVTQSEQQLGQKYEIDLKIGTANDQFSIVLAGQSDDLEQTLDYAIIVDSVIKIGTQVRKIMKIREGDKYYLQTGE